MNTEFLLCFALILGGFAFLQWSGRAARKFSIVCFCLASALGVFALTHNWECALLAVGAWVVFPMAELIFVVRKLRVPHTRKLEDALPLDAGRDELNLLSRELIHSGFVQVDECRLIPAMHEQFYRLFIHESEPVHASIGCVGHENFSFQFIGFSTQDQFGRLWLTWDYPLTYGLKVPPEMVVYRNLEAETCDELFQSHLEFLEINNVDKAHAAKIPGREGARERLQRALRLQLEFNIQQGILLPERPNAENYRYSWRGTFFVTRQVLKDLTDL